MLWRVHVAFGVNGIYCAVSNARRSLMLKCNSP
jgi:hypothetical protein